MLHTWALILYLYHNGVAVKSLSIPGFSTIKSCYSAGYSCVEYGKDYYISFKCVEVK